ncbi:MAG TPA: hypothetical protein VGQ81_05600 [Acidobacteriota bacterium]|nr:hypothetical protein [Acidobacteriota bacterium]
MSGCSWARVEAGRTHAAFTNNGQLTTDAAIRNPKSTIRNQNNPQSEI